MGIQDEIMQHAMLEAAIRECGTIVIRKHNWDAVTLKAKVKLAQREDGARVLTLGEPGDERETE